MPSISKIRLTNIVYEEGRKRYNDELFLFDGHNGAVLLENGGGKTVLIQTALQAIIPHVDLADRKMKRTLMLENAPAHIAIEWITNDQPRRYVVTAVSLFTTKHGLDSLRYVYEYDANDPNSIEGIPFVRKGKDRKRTAELGEMQDYYSHMRDKSPHNAQTFQTIKAYQSFLEEQYHIIASEWDSIVKINSSEGGVEAFFDNCKSTNQLFDRLLIPTVESSIVGHDATIFADMFEQQHTSFKNYKKLKETLEENNVIQEQLEFYVNTYEKLHDRELEYQKVKQQAKGVWNETLKQRSEFENEQSNVEAKLEEWNKNDHAYRVKEMSFDIFQEEMVYQELEATYKQALAKKTEQEELLQQYDKDYYSLKVAELKKDRKEQADELRHIEAELAAIDQTAEITDYQEKLEEEKQRLLGWYLTEIEKLEKDKQTQNYQLRPIQEQMEQLDIKKRDLVKNEQEMRDILSKMKGIIESRKKDMDQLKQQLLSNPDQEDVKEQLAVWQKRSQFLDEEIIRLNGEEKQLRAEEKQAQERNEANQIKLSEIENNKNKVAYQLDEMEKNQTELVANLTMLRQQWATVENVYLSQGSIEKRLIEEIDKRVNERNRLLSRERVSYRFVDDHAEQERFFGDAYLAEQLASWKNQFDYLVTGVEYLQVVGEQEKNRLTNYPLWAITLVTTDKLKQKVIDKVRHVSDNLQFPIIVITTEEAVAMHEGTTNQSWVAPSHWDNNIDYDSFINWKEQTESRAKEITVLREEKEAEIKRWEDGLKAFNQFLKAYPYKYVTQLQEQFSALKNEQQELVADMEKEKRFIAEQQAKIGQNRKQIETYRDEKQGIDGKIEKGFQYVKFEKEIKVEQSKEKDATEKVAQLTKELTRIENNWNRFEDERIQLQERLNNLDAHLKMIEQEEEYNALQTLTPLYVDEGKGVIKERIFTLEMKIREINVAQGEWIAKQQALVKALERLDQSIVDVLQEHPAIDQDRSFPSDGKQVMRTLWADMIDLNERVERLTEDMQQRKTTLDEQKGKWKSKIDQFKRDYPNDAVILFEETEEEIRATLESERTYLSERKTFIDQELSRIEKALKEINSANYDLKMFEEAHHFTAPDIEAIALSTEESMEFTYNRKQFVKAITDRLRDNKKKVDTERKDVEAAKRKFRDFCINTISDVKLKKMAINGVENKQNYAAITEFKKNMLIRIEKISHYANEHIRKSDEDLQLFINQIHSHLLTLVEELKQIPKKTRVKVGDEWKQIYKFTIPEWEEEVGKMRIRDYVEWILQQLESDQFSNESGLQDDGKVRKQIEMWLQSKQLLQMVMNNEVMKVNCRKVTNDIQVTTRPYSWEQSNLWSGGEKWSKNMTLFLGILNYVAEKKKHIQSSMKRHRTVILDNPFGKASSDHVLSPVFFIAEQLGFQIIALTAHAEGKFLQDYFPVIYSCRLRASTDASKKVMTKEKWLHHAYFQDHDPITIDRLGENEQMALFE
ncbi:membrane protein [Paraliobacillus quinghaiensis]|uniref:Membrane protein n=1 Tax=Paraliobacillus quinghaiensis TaxID=470815 RepID=A0A917TE60_9BACI|nr:hypothetical protein [Paraliobacillus quinghaiensis]GGM19014.1 membrane protein [Paraliobacillus quinghaiensis]